MNSTVQEAIPLAVREQAVDWLLELQSAPADAALRQRWQAWCEADPMHAQAWAKVAAFGGRLQTLPPHIVSAALNAPASSVARRDAVKALALVIGGAGSAWLAAELAPWRAWSADRSTGVGERATLALADGTRVQMNAGSAVNIRYSARERRLQLLRGEILISTAHDRQQRPFSVDTSAGNARALGTRYLVRQFDGSTTVAVFEGAVELRPARTSQVVRLGAGQQAVYTQADVGSVTAADEASTAWVNGMIVAQDMPLPAFLAALDHYRRGTLHCAPAAAHLAVSGTYPLADPERVLDMLQMTLPVSVSHTTRYWTTVNLKKTEKK